MGSLFLFQIDRILWAEEVKINFTVIFDNDFSLKNGRHHIVTPVGLLYYKDYTDDGHVITKGASFSSPLQTVIIEINIPGANGLKYFTKITTILCILIWTFRHQLLFYQ